MGDTAGTADVRITVDVICAPSYIAFTRFSRVLAARRAAGARVAVTFLPFELAPGAPTDGEPALDALERQFGAQGLASARRLAALAAEDGLVLDYEKAVASGSFRAHRLIGQATEHGLAEAMVERLFRANFTDGLNIGDEATLRRLATEVGFTADSSGDVRTRAALDAVRASGVHGVPVFEIGGETLHGLHPAAVYADALDRALHS